MTATIKNDAKARMEKSVDALKQQLKDRGLGHFASGWVWLAEKDGKLSIEETHDADTLAEITTLYRDTGYVIDPHTATGVLAARLYRRSMVAPMVTLGEIAPCKSAALLAGQGIEVAAPVVARGATQPMYVIDATDLGAVQQVLRRL